MATIILPARLSTPVDTLLDIITPSGFVADCEATDLIGDPVTIVSTDKVASMAVNVYSNLSIGIIYQKPTPTTCVVIIGGIIRNIATGLVPNKAVWISETGGLTGTSPTTGHAQVMGTAITATDMVVNVAPNKVIQ